MDTAFVIVDMLNDFILPSGALYFERGRSVVKPVARLKAAFRAAGAPVLYVGDAHPADSAEFSEWPPHCLAGSFGAQVVQDLAPEPGDIVLCKDALSVFHAGFAERVMRGLGAAHLCMAGVATEYSVKACALDAVALGFTVTVIPEDIAGVDIHAGDAAMALEAMRQAGVRFADSAAVLASLR